MCLAFDRQSERSFVGLFERTGTTDMMSNVHFGLFWSQYISRRASYMSSHAAFTRIAHNFLPLYVHIV